MKYTTLARKLPIYSERLKIAVINTRDIRWYAKELKKEYFLKWVKNKSYMMKISNITIKINLESLISTYKMPCEFKYEFRLTIKYKETNIPIGGITLFPGQSSDTLEIAYWIMPEYQGKGLASEAVQAIIEYAKRFSTNYKYVVANINKHNEASINVALKCGMQCIGIQDSTLIYRRELN